MVLSDDIVTLMYLIDKWIIKINYSNKREWLTKREIEIKSSKWNII